MEDQDLIGLVEEEETEDEDYINFDRLEDSSDEASIVSNDSITRNADFVEFDY